MKCDIWQRMDFGNGWVLAADGFWQRMGLATDGFWQRMGLATDGFM